MKYYDILKNLRKEKGLYQKDIAALCNVTQASYQQWESGKTQPDINNLIRLSDYYKVSVDYLIGREDEAGFITAADFIMNDDVSFLKVLHKLPHTDRVKVIGYAEGLLYEKHPDNN